MNSAASAEAAKAAAVAAAASAGAGPTTVGLAIATAAICFGLGWACQMVVGATPLTGDPRSVAGTYNLFTRKELTAMGSDKERIDAYYNKRANLHDVLFAVTNEDDVQAASRILETKTAEKEYDLLRRAVKEYYPAAAPIPSEVAQPRDVPPPQFAAAPQLGGRSPARAHIAVGT